MNMQKANDHHTAVRLGKDKDMDFITNEEREAFWDREVPDDAQRRRLLIRAGGVISVAIAVGTTFAGRKRGNAL